MSDLSHVCFRDVAWLQNIPLDDTSVMDYFAMSQFYDRTCNNEVLKMQARFTDNAALLSQLHKMTGVEYAVLSSQPPKLFIIAKQQRHSPEKTSILSLHYVLDGSIYMAPSVHGVIGSRVTLSLYYLNEALKYAKKFVSFDSTSCQYVLPSSQNDTLMTEEDLRLDRIIMSAIDKPVD